MLSAEKKLKIIQEIKSEIANENFEKVTNLRTESGLDALEIDSIANTVFAELVVKQSYTKALAVGKQYKFPNEKIQTAVTKQFTFLYGKGEFKEAIDWGNEYNLSSNEILKAQVKLFEKALKKNEISQAIEIKEKYDINFEAINAFVHQIFSNLYQKNDFYSAALIAQYFKFPMQRLALAVSKGFRAANSAGDLQKVLEFEKKFELLSDPMFEQLQIPEQERIIEAFQTKIIEPNRENPDVIIKVLESTGFLKRRYFNKLLSDLMKITLNYLNNVHKQYLLDDQLDKAVKLVKQFELYDEGMAAEIREQIIYAALDYHNKLLTEEKNYARALRVKTEYTELFKSSHFEDPQTGQKAALDYFAQALKQGDIDLAIKASGSYHFSDSQVNQAASGALINAIKKANFEEAFTIMKEFKIDPSGTEILNAAEAQFNSALKGNQSELAAEIGFHFGLDKHTTQDMAFQTWQNHLKSGRYQEALEYKKRHKLPKKWLEPVIQDVYKFNRQTGDSKQALQLRKEYKIKVGVIDLITEFLQKYGIGK